MKSYTRTISGGHLQRLILQLAAIIVLLFSNTPLHAQEATVTFTVDMQFTPLAPGERLVLRGSSAALGRWLGGDLQLSRAGGSLYGITVGFAGRDLNKTHQYKFAVLGEEEHWESRPSRSFTLRAGHQDLEPVLFNDLDRPVLREDLPVSISLNLDAFPGEPPTRVAISGNRQPLGEVVPSQLTMMEEAAGLWQAELLFEAGTPVDVAFQFYFEVDGLWTGEKRRHAVMLNNNRATRLVELIHDGQRIVPVTQGDLMLDDYQRIATAIGEGGRRHYLEEALLQLEAGRLVLAEAAYEDFGPYLETLSEEEKHLGRIYPIRHGQALYGSGEKSEATNYLRIQGMQSADPDHYEHALAQAQLAAGDYEQAEATFESLRSSGNADLSESAAFAQAVAKLKQGRYREGTSQLEAFEGSDKKAQAALRALGHAHRDSAHYAGAEAAFEALAVLGTDEQQLKARLQLLQVQLEAGRATDAIDGVEALLSDTPASDEQTERLRQAAAKSRYRTAHLLWLKAGSYEQQGSDAGALYDELITHYADTHHGKLAQKKRGN